MKAAVLFEPKKPLDPDAPGSSVQPFATGLDFPIDLKRSTDGSIYVLQHGADDSNIGSLVKLSFVGATDQKPLITTPPKSQSTTSRRVPCGSMARSGRST